MKNYQHPIIGKDEIRAVIDSLCSDDPLSGFLGSEAGHLGGKKVRELEEAFCKYFNVKYAVAMNSATSCLHAAVVACGVKMGDEVIVTPFSFSSSASCVLMANAIPVFADIDPRTFCLAPQSISRAITPRTRAILPVHLCGGVADMDEIMTIAKEHSLKVVEDAAQAPGAMFQGKYAGTIGDCGIFSFNQSKHISAGEGGMLITNDDEIARRARAIRNHGEISVNGELGYNYRMTELTAALVLPQLKKLDEMNQWRIGLADLLSFQLDNIEGITPPFVRSDCKHVYYTYAMRYDEPNMPMSRDEFQRRMLNHGVYFGSGYVKPIYLQRIYQERLHDVYRYFGQSVNYEQGLCPITEDMWKHRIMVTDRLRYPMESEEIYQIIDVIGAILRNV